jgi:acyl-[acyl-carrier-protein] desaturase
MDTHGALEFGSSSAKTPGEVNEPSEKLWTPASLRARGIAALRATPGLIRTSGEPDQLEILEELEGLVATNIDRHNDAKDFWIPSDFFPIDAEGNIINRRTNMDEPPLLSPTAQAAMIVNLLTEDNLPAYHRIIATNFGLDGAWGTWVNQWTAEENRHAYVMRAFLDLTRAVNPAELEAEREKHMIAGYSDNDKDPLHTLAYVTFQELATRVSHRNTGFATEDPIADKMLARISQDENLHMLFYRNLVAGAFEIAPNQTMRAITDEVKHFEMPGAGMNNFKSRSLLIARDNIYNIPQHLNKVVWPILKSWKVFKREDLSGDGEVARQELAAFLVKLKAQAERFIQKRDSGLIDSLIVRAQASEKA